MAFQSPCTGGVHEAHLQKDFVHTYTHFNLFSREMAGALQSSCTEGLCEVPKNSRQLIGASRGFAKAYTEGAEQSP